MSIAEPLPFVGNLLAFLTLGWKTVYDLLVNPRRFRSEVKTMDELKAAGLKRQRGDRSTAITFMLLAVSYGLFLWDALR